MENPTPDNSNNPPNNAANGTGQPPRDYWCHQCQTEITPIMVPDPICPTCHNSFVEKIEADNDPRTFVQPAPAQGLPGGLPTSQDGHPPAAHEPVSLDDLFRLFQAFSNPQRAMQQQRMQQHMHEQQRHTGQIFSSGSQIIFTPDGSVLTSRSGGDPAAGGGHILGGYGAGRAEQGAAGSEGQAPSAPQWHSPPAFINGLLNRLGIELHYTTDPGALGQGFGGPSFFNMVGNPGDYVHGQSGLDNIISQMMELQNRQHGPVGASDEIVNALPHHKVSPEQLAAKDECTVCKDEFKENDNCLELPCKHYFHEDCIKPWLKVSGTCPSCRYSLVGGQDGAHPPGSTLPPAPGTTPANASSGTGGLAAPPGGPPGGTGGTSIPGSFPSSPANPPVQNTNTGTGTSPNTNLSTNASTGVDTNTSTSTGVHPVPQHEPLD